MDDITVNWKWEGSRLSRIITGSRYKTSEVVQLLALLKIWGLLDKKMLKERVSEATLEEWSKNVMNEMRRVFCVRLEEKGLDCKT